MKILAFAATTSTQSINKQLIGYAARLLQDVPGTAVDVEILDLNDFEMPIFSVDRERESGLPQAARDFHQRIGEADALLISFAEHNGFYTAAYKNLFDWMSRIDKQVYQGKPTVMLATSSGAHGGANVLATAVNSAGFFGNDVKAHLAIPNFHDNFDAEAGALSDPDLDGQFRAALGTLVPGAESAAA
jgi:NAD(P)H-dependent FMN reductase